LVAVSTHSALELIALRLASTSIGILSLISRQARARCNDCPKSQKLPGQNFRQVFCAFGWSLQAAEASGSALSPLDIFLSRQSMATDESIAPCGAFIMSFVASSALNLPQRWKTAHLLRKSGRSWAFQFEGDHPENAISHDFITDRFILGDYVSIREDSEFHTFEVVSIEPVGISASSLSQNESSFISVSSS
jgi:hypothetical protein